MRQTTTTPPSSDSRIDHLVLLDNLRAHLSEIAEILLRPADLHDASTAIAPLLGIDETEVEFRLTASTCSP